MCLSLQNEYFILELKCQLIICQDQELAGNHSEFYFLFILFLFPFPSLHAIVAQRSFRCLIFNEKAPPCVFFFIFGYCAFVNGFECSSRSHFWKWKVFHFTSVCMCGARTVSGRHACENWWLC